MQENSLNFQLKVESLKLKGKKRLRIRRLQLAAIIVRAKRDKNPDRVAV